MFFVENESRKQVVLNKLMEKPKQLKASVVKKQTKKINKKRKKSPKKKKDETNKNNLNVMIEKTKVPISVANAAVFMNSLKPKEDLPIEEPTISSANEIPEPEELEAIQVINASILPASVSLPSVSLPAVSAPATQPVSRSQPASTSQSLPTISLPSTGRRGGY